MPDVCGSFGTRLGYSRTSSSCQCVGLAMLTSILPPPPPMCRELYRAEASERVHYYQLMHLLPLIVAVACCLEAAGVLLKAREVFEEARLTLCRKVNVAIGQPNAPVFLLVHFGGI